MRILSVIQPSELGSDFRLEDGVWKVNFPSTGGGTGNELSTDENNALSVGTDGGLFLSKDLLNAYAMVQDNQSQKIHLYRFPAGSVFSIETATLVSSVSLIEMTGIFDDVAIDGEVITFTDADTGLTLTIDTATLQRVDALVGSETVEVMSVNGTTTLSVKIDPRPDNAIQITEEGLLVTGGGEVGDVNLLQTLAVVEDGLCHAVGNSHLVIPQIELVDVAGKSIGYINDIIGLPVSSQAHGPDHCPKWEAPTANNCRIDKTAVALIPDLLYQIGGDTGSAVEWRIFMDGQDTGYIATAGGSGGVEATALSLTQEDFGDSNDYNGKGWLEDVISNATNGAVSGAYTDFVTLLNETNQQVILTLVPSVSVTLNDLRNAFEGGSLTIWGLTTGEVAALRNGTGLEEDPIEENLEDYFDEETGVLSICLAPNGSGNGGSTGPQISCAGATDRFATSGLWYNWTLKVNGVTLVTNGESGQVIEALENSGIRVGYNGETETTYRNMTTENIRIELIAGQPTSSWDKIYLLIDKSTNPTLMGYDPIQHQAEAAMMAMSSIDSMQESEQFQRITVCLAPANDWMNWDYKDIDTSTAEITLTNSVNLVDAVQGFRFEGEPNITIDTDVNKWGDLIWIIRAEEPLRTDVTLTIDHPNYSDEYTCDFFARKPMVITLANTHEYARPIEVNNPFDEAATIASIEVVSKKGSTLISNPEEGLVIDAATGAIRVDDLENGQFSYIVQGRFVDSEVSDVMKVKFVTVDDFEEIVTVDLTTNSNPDFQPVSTNANSRVLIGLVDNTEYNDVRNLPAIRIESPDWSETYLYRTNMVGGEATMEFDFSQASTYKLYIHAYLNDGELAILGDCVIGVDEWGDLEAGGYTFNRETYDARFEASEIDFTSIGKNNLAYVPAESPSNLRNMTGMFAGTDLGYPEVDLSAYNVSSVYSMAGVFAHSNFNGDILGWDMRWVSIMDYAFYGSRFKQNLANWCMLNITSEPMLFAHRGLLPRKFYPSWGNCPTTYASFRYVPPTPHNLEIGTSIEVDLYWDNRGGNNNDIALTGVSNDPKVAKFIPLSKTKFMVEAVGEGNTTITTRVNNLYDRTVNVSVYIPHDPLIMTYSGVKAVPDKTYMDTYDVAIALPTNELTTVDWGDGNVIDYREYDIRYNYAPGTPKSTITVTFHGNRSLSKLWIGGAVDEIVQWYGGNVDSYCLGRGEHNAINQLVKVPDHLWPNATNISTLIYAQPVFDDETVRKWDVSNITSAGSVFSSSPEFNQSLKTWNLAKAVTNLTGRNGFIRDTKLITPNYPVFYDYNQYYKKPYDEYTSLYNPTEWHELGLLNTYTEVDNIITSGDRIEMYVHWGLENDIFTEYKKIKLYNKVGYTVDEGAWFNDPSFPSDMFDVVVMGDFTLSNGNDGKAVKLVNISGETVEVYFRKLDANGGVSHFNYVAIDNAGNLQNGLSPYTARYITDVRALMFPAG